MFNLIAFLTFYTLTVHAQHITKEGDKVMASCTAVYIGEKTAITAAHCINETGKIWVRNSDNQSFNATILRRDTKLDLCTLHIQGPAHPYVELGKPVKRGDKVEVISSEYDMPGTYGEGIVENIVLDDEHSVLQICHSATILPGASGSGLFDKYGNLVGINVTVFQGLSFAVDETVLESFLLNR